MCAKYIYEVLDDDGELLAKGDMTAIRNIMNCTNNDITKALNNSGLLFGTHQIIQISKKESKTRDRFNEHYEEVKQRLLKYTNTVIGPDAKKIIDKLIEEGFELKYERRKYNHEKPYYYVELKNV